MLRCYTLAMVLRGQVALSNTFRKGKIHRYFHLLKIKSLMVNFVK